MFHSTYAEVRVDAGVSGGAGEILVFAVLDVLVRARVAVLLRQPEVDDVDEVALLAKPHQEVIRLHVSVDEVLRVDVLHSAYLRQEDSTMFRSWTHQWTHLTPLA